MNHYASGLQASDAAVDFTPADERDVLERLAVLTERVGPLEAARRLFIPQPRRPE